MKPFTFTLLLCTLFIVSTFGSKKDSYYKQHLKKVRNEYKKKNVLNRGTKNIYDEDEKPSTPRFGGKHNDDDETNSIENKWSFGKLYDNEDSDDTNIVSLEDVFDVDNDTDEQEEEDPESYYKQYLKRREKNPLRNRNLQRFEKVYKETVKTIPELTAEEKENSYIEIELPLGLADIAWSYNIVEGPLNTRVTGYGAQTTVPEKFQDMLIGARITAINHQQYTEQKWVEAKKEGTYNEETKKYDPKYTMTFEVAPEKYDALKKYKQLEVLYRRKNDQITKFLLDNKKTKGLNIDI